MESNTEIKRTYHLNGKIKTERQVFNGKTHGISKSYFETGGLMFLDRCFEGFDLGIREFWHEDGSRNGMNTWKRNLHGLWISFIY